MTKVTVQKHLIMTHPNSNRPQYRFQLPKKAIKVDCPNCGPRHRKTLSLFVDSVTGETLPDMYGRCDRESKCGYFLSPYDRSISGVSYADEMRLDQRQKIPKAFFHIAWKWKKNGASRENLVKELQDPLVGAIEQQAEIVTRHVFEHSKVVMSPEVVYELPNELLKQSLSHYEHNQFALLLCSQFGSAKAEELIKQFQIGTSAHWPGACVFWLIDEQNRVRGGQIKQFADDWHTAKYTAYNGETYSCTSWVHHALQRRMKKDGKALPDWLTEYNSKAEKSPCLFGLPQLITTSPDTPIAIVEAPKTAVICSAYFPKFTWLAVMGKSYLKPERLDFIRHRRILLYPDINAYSDWQKIAEVLNRQGFRIEVSNYLEQHASDEQRKAGLDLADFLLKKHPTVSTVSEQLNNPGSILRPDTSRIIYLPVITSQNYPSEWD